MHGLRFPARRSALSVFAALALGLCAGLAACGGDGGSGADRATLVLDFVPGPVHAGVYRALAEGYYAEAGIDLEIVEPTSTADTLKLIAAGKADFGFADGIDLATQIDAGRDAKGVLALTQRPLGGLITLVESGFDSPAALEGATVGVTGVPSDDAVLDTMVSGSGGEPALVDTITIGFNGVQALAGGRIDAFTGYIPTDAVQAELEGFPTTSFALDAYGGPRYPGLVAFSTERRLAEDPGLIERFVGATIRGYEDVIARPTTGVEALLAENPAIDPRFATASLRAHLPLFEAAGRRFGEFDRGDVADLSGFLVDSGLLSEPLAPHRYATNEFVDRAQVAGGGG